jgi:hypothetical protein
MKNIDIYAGHVKLLIRIFTKWNGRRFVKPKLKKYLVALLKRANDS